MSKGMILHKLNKTRKDGTMLYSQAGSSCRIRDEYKIGAAIYLGDDNTEFIEVIKRPLQFFAYRFINASKKNEQFQIAWRGEYRNANTIDFDF